MMKATLRRMDADNPLRKRIVPVVACLTLFGAMTAAAADPTIPAWIDINAQIAAPVVSTQTATWSVLDMVTTDSEVSSGFDFTSFPFGLLLLFR